MEDEKVEEVCKTIAGVVVPANYNCPGQLVISGSVESVNAACEALKAAGAKRALVLQVGGAFHSPLMEPARAELATAIAYTPIVDPRCPVYQNVDARPHTDPARIKANLIAQLTAPVRWTQTMQHMLADGATKVEAVRLLGELAPEGRVVALLIVLDRQEVRADGRDAVASFRDDCGVPVHPVLGLTDLVDHLAETGRVPAADLARCKTYWGEYGTAAAKEWAAR